MLGKLATGTGWMACQAGAALITVSGHAGVDTVGGGLFVTGQATIDATIRGIGVAIGTFAPQAVVRSGIYREIQTIVFGKLDSCAIRVAGQARGAHICIAANTLMDVIGSGCLVTAKTAELRPIVGVVVAIGTGGPFAGVRPGEYGEIQGVVVAEVLCFAPRMAEVTVLTIIIVPRYASVVFVGIGPVVLVTAEAAEFLKVIRVDVTGGAIVPFAGVFAGEDGEEGVVVGQQGRPERGHLVAFFAVGREAGTDVVRTGDFQVLLLVTADASCCLEREIAYGQALVATLAVGQGVTTHHREIRFGVDVFYIENRKAIDAVTFLTIRSQFGFVDIFVAVQALFVNDREVLQGVAPGAIGAIVTAFKDKPGTVGVGELDARPSFKGVADFALEVDILMRHILSQGA